MRAALRAWTRARSESPSIRIRLHNLAGGTVSDASPADARCPGVSAGVVPGVLVSPATATLESPFGSVVAVLPCAEQSSPAIIGRGQDATVRLGELSVHRAHASVRWDAASGTHVIEHLGGANGTYVDGARVTFSRHLTDGCAIMLGKTVLMYRRGLPEKPVASQKGVTSGPCPRELSFSHAPHSPAAWRDATSAASVRA